MSYDYSENVLVQGSAGDLLRDELGLSYQGGHHKFIYDVFKNIDRPGSEVVTEFAKSIIGIESWSEITQG